jgi:uncharacterized membrane protein YgdD (TMEM256/DUF423 family)
MTLAKLIGLAACIYGFLGVALGAFGAHGLKNKLSPDLLAVWKTAVEYQFYHLPPLLFLAAWSAWKPESAVLLPAGLLAAGVLVFSGSLYALALTGIRGLGAVTPLGGLLLMAGWAVLAWRVYRAS